jgi:hypothetical protein
MIKTAVSFFIVSPSLPKRTLAPRDDSIAHRESGSVSKGSLSLPSSLIHEAP